MRRSPLPPANPPSTASSGGGGAACGASRATRSSSRRRRRAKRPWTRARPRPSPNRRCRGPKTAPRRPKIGRRWRRAAPRRPRPRPRRCSVRFVTGAGPERRAASARRRARARTHQAARRRPEIVLAGRGSVAARYREPRLLEGLRRARAVAGRDRRALPHEGVSRDRLRHARASRRATPSSRAASP